MSEKIDFGEIAIKEGVMPNMIVCGNCDHYIWGERKEKGAYDRHCGMCNFQKTRTNDTVSMFFAAGDLHALTGAEICSRFLKVVR